MTKKLTPKQKRLIRENKESEKTDLKKARLLQRPEFKKEARSLCKPDIEKTPKIQKNPDSIMQYKMEWGKKDADLTGEWSWGQPRKWTDKEWYEIILKGFPKINHIAVNPCQIRVYPVF